MKRLLIVIIKIITDEYLQIYKNITSIYKLVKKIAKHTSFAKVIKMPSY
jgi:hypothetical protein